MYLGRLELQAMGDLDYVSIDWSIVDHNLIRTFSAGRRAGLQIADAVAGSFWYGVEYSRHEYLAWADACEQYQQVVDSFSRVYRNRTMSRSSE